MLQLRGTTRERFSDSPLWNGYKAKKKKNQQLWKISLTFGIYQDPFLNPETLQKVSICLQLIECMVFVSIKNLKKNHFYYANSHIGVFNRTYVTWQQFDRHPQVFGECYDHHKVRQLVYQLLVRIFFSLVDCSVFICKKIICLIFGW